MLMRAVMTLLAVLFTTLSAHATLTCNAMPSSNCGTVEAEGCLVYVTPAAGYIIYSVRYYNEAGTNFALQEIGMPASSTDHDHAGTACYQAPSTEGTVTATFAPKGNNVLVHFDMNGYGAQVSDQKRQLGQTVARPTPDPESGVEDVTFLGWSTNRTGTPITYYDFSTVLSNSLNYSFDGGCYTLTLYARWDVKSGSCGTGVYWQVSKSEGSSDYDVLTISGSGTIEKMRSSSYPWYAFRSSIKKVVIGDGVKNIPASAFYMYRQITDVTIGNSVETIGDKAFYETGLTSLTIGNSVDTIGNYAFYKTSLTSLTIGNSVETIGKYAFYKTSLESLTFGKSVETIGGYAFDNCWSGEEFDILLPASLKVIKKYAFGSFPGDHVYITVPDGATLTVNGKAYAGEIEDGKADLIGYLFKNRDKRKKSMRVTTAVTLDLTDYTITTDGNCTAYYNDDYANEITTARAGETVILSLDGDMVPAGRYVSGFNINGGAVEAVANEDNTDYYFIMPAGDVSVTTLTSQQEEYTLDLTEEEQVAIPETMFILLNSLMGYFGGDTDGNMWIDINLDGAPDLQLKRPVEEDEEADPDDEFPNEYTVKRLAGADALPKNYRFTPVYPFPYRYNSILVKLGEDREVQQQIRIDEELSDSDPYDNNQSLITMHAESTEEGPLNVLISGRTLRKDGSWNTLCLPFDVTLSGSPFEGAEARPLSEASISGTTLSLTFGEAVTKLVAGTPYIIKWVEPATNIVNPVFCGVTFEAADRSYDNGAKGDQRVRFVGTYGSTTFDAEDKGTLLMGDASTLGHPDDGMSIGAFRAYICLPPTVSLEQLTDVVLDKATTTTADFNGDQRVDILDITSLIDYLVKDKACTITSIESNVGLGLGSVAGVR